MAVTNNTLGGVILAGDSWLSGTKNTQRISEQIGQPVTNVAVGGFTTQDTINQLNSFLQGGGTFAPNSTVMLDVGGNDLLQNVNPQNIKSNLQQLVSTLGNNGVKVILSGAPEVSSVSEVTGSKNLKISNIFKDVAQNNPNVTLVDSMSGLLNQKNLVDETGFHLNEAGQTAFNAALSNAYLQSQGLEPIKYSEQAIKDFIVNNNLSLDQALSLAPSFSVSADRVRSALTDSSAWDYDKYVEGLKSGKADFNREFDKLGGELGQNAKNIYREILDQQNRGSGEFWSKGNTASPQAAAADFALRLAENGIGSLSQLGQVTIKDPTFEQPDQQITINKATGQPLPRAELLGRGQRGLDIDYNLAFAADGTAIPFTSNRESSWMKFREETLKPAAAFALNFVGAPLIGAAVAPGLSLATQGAIGGAIAGGAGAALTDGNVLTGALLGGAGGYLQGANAVAPGLGPQTDASFLAADAAQLAAQGLSESQIASVLGSAGYASGPAANLAASMAVNGLDVGMMTQQLNALSTNTGLMSQTGSSADFLAADALQLQNQLGNNFAAIEQNLVASGVDPLVAADVSQQLAFNTNLTQTDLATNLANSFGNNIYDVDMATTYPTSTLPGSGGLLSDVAGAATTPTTTVTTPTTATTTTTTGTGGSTLGTTLGGLTASQIADLLKAGVSLAALSGAANAVSGGNNTPMQTPTQGVPTNNPNYYNQLQQYYNAYLPQTPRDVVSPLQQWYEGSFGNTGTRTVAPQQAQTAMSPAPSGTAMPTAPARPIAPTSVAPTAPIPVPMAAPTGLLNTPMTAQQQVQNLLSNPNLSSLPPEAASAISRAVSSPRSFNDVVAGGGVNTVDVSSLSPEIQRAYDIYQQSMILGTNRDVAESVYKRAGVDPTNPDAFFSNLGLLAGTPTKTALAQYAPVALDRFANTGGGALTFTVDPSTIPTDYVKPNIPMSNFNMGLFTSLIRNNEGIPESMKQNYITEAAQKYGFNPADFI